MLFYIEYGCSISQEHLIIETENHECAEQYAEAAAVDVYWSYDCNYLHEEDYDSCTEEEINEFEYEKMIFDIFWLVELYDETNEVHKEAFEEQGRIPYEV